MENDHAAGNCRVLRDVLADVWRLRRRRAGGGVPSLGIGFLECRYAFGLTVLTMAYAVGIFRAGHFNPAVNLGAVVGRSLCKPACPALRNRPGGRRYCRRRGALVHRLRQVGLGCWWLCIERLRRTQPGKYSLAACFATEVLLTFFFIFIIVGTTSKGPPWALPAFDRFSADFDPLGLDPCYQHLCQSGPQHRPRICSLAGSISHSSGCFGSRR